VPVTQGDKVHVDEADHVHHALLSHLGQREPVSMKSVPTHVRLLEIPRVSLVIRDVLHHPDRDGRQ